ncbi:hypothetical protein [Marixanthomonas spongiae]|uniref:Lmo0937 family membrane protein n=1 Tax=Marixanthomonas spongiae TaxID=2174845 RepID=A0A2U0HZ92_9FLAO|nr:hypothetical protein [Marixanthomonas spongiae]PVW14139.1 hypothetical protein DDV96_10005 [Marixanthomonas spongiae]
MKTFFLILSIVFGATWLVGVLFFDFGVLFHLVFLAAVIFYILKMIWEELSRKHPYLKRRKKRKG